MCTLILDSASWQFSSVLSLSCKKLFGLGDDEVCIYGLVGVWVAGYKEDPVWLWDGFCDDLLFFLLISFSISLGYFLMWIDDISF
jgi:hypothetical protein